MYVDYGPSAENRMAVGDAGDPIESIPAAGSAMILAMEQPAHIKVSGALEGEFIITEERNANEFVITRDTSWKSMLGKEERDATEEEIAALEAEHGPFLPADGEG
jgi:hypothetical protein